MVNADHFMGITYGWHEQYLGDGRGYWNGIIVPNLRELGAGMVRTEVKCNDHLPPPARSSADGGTINYQGVYDHVMTHLNQAGIEVLALFDYRTVNLPITDINQPPDRPDGTNPYVRRLATAAGEFAARYSGRPGSAGRLAALELWNEPNACFPLWSAGGRRPDYEQVRPECYAALLVAVEKAVRPVAPDVQLVAGALLSDTSGQPNKRPAAYLQAVTSAPALRGARPAWPWNAVSMHPYGQPEAIPGEVGQLAHALDTAGSNAPVWITELGYSLCHGANTPDQQAARLTAAANAARATGRVARFVWFTFHDWGDGSCSDPGQKMGLCTVGPDQRVRERRPAWEAYRRLAAS